VVDLCRGRRKFSFVGLNDMLILKPVQRKFNVPVTITLIRGGLVEISAYDLQLAKLIIRDYRPNIVDFAANLIAECSLGEGAPAPRNAFSFSLEALGRAAQADKATEQYVSQLNTMFG
jgi:CCR4-NOT transcription complex subunit 1